MNVKKNLVKIYIITEYFTILYTEKHWKRIYYEYFFNI